MNTVKSEGGFALWVTGLPASGKSTLTRALEKKLKDQGVRVAVLESDELRKALSMESAYDEAGRDAFYAAMLWIGKLLVSNRVPVIFDATANLRRYREQARSSIDGYMEIYVDCPLEECVRRDPKGIYRDGLRGNSDSIPGLQSEYEIPLAPEVVVSGREQGTDAAVDQVLAALTNRGFIGSIDSQ